MPARVRPQGTVAEPAPPRRAYSVPEFAMSIGVHQSTAWALVYAEKIPTFRAGNRVLIAAEAIDEFIRSGGAR